MSQNTLLTKFLRTTKFLLIFIILCSIFFGAFYLINQLFQIKKIKIISDTKFTIVNDSWLKNKNLIFLDPNQTSLKISKENYLVKKAQVEKEWPSTVKIAIDLYEPVASLVVSKGFFNLSSDGRILSKKTDEKTLLPQINYYQKLNNNGFETGDWINFKDISNTLFFIEVLQRINLSPLTIDIKGQDMLVFNLSNNQQIIFSNSKSKEVQDYQLELIVRQFKIEGKELKKIDLRFEKPIVAF